MVEITLETMAIDADIPPAEMIDAGNPATVHVQVVGGNELPFEDPRHPDRPLRHPALAVNFQLTKKAALAFAARLQSKAESLPDQGAASKLAVVSDLSDVGKVVEFERKLKGS